jgi:GH25 family lysozyme M1 (1,4-beta-N-acetylmuramidase)
MRQRTSRISRVLVAAVAASAVAVPVSFAASPASAAKVYDGPDVASYQHPHPTSAHPHGQPINWHKVKRAGKEFAIVKATEGTSYTNPYFDGPYYHDYADAAAAGLAHGAYHFARPALPIVSTATAQAKYFANVVGSVTTPDTLPPALDLEVTGGLNPPQLVTWAQVFLLKLRQLTDRTPMLYTYPSFYDSDLADVKALTRYPLWMAHYGTSQAPVADLWQYTSSAHVNGIVGNVDMSKFVGARKLNWPTLSDGTVATPWKAAPPGPPQSVGAAITGTTATIHWIPGDAGTSRITHYRVTASPGGQTKTVPATTFSTSFTDLTPATTYTFTVTGINSVDAGTPSTPSNPVTPTVPTVLSAAVTHAVTYGDPLPVRAKLRRADNKKALADQKVLLFRRHTPTARWHRIATLRTDADGAVSTVLQPHRSGQLEVVFPGATGIERSAVFKNYVVRPVVTAALSATTVEHGQTVTLSGTVTPAEAGQIVTRQRRLNGFWRSRGTTKVTKTGTFSFRITPKFTGKYVFRLVAAATDVRGTGHSDRVTLTST